MSDGEAQARAVREEIAELADPVFANRLSGFFKTGPGEYGEGDRFVGVRAPALDRIARTTPGIELDALAILLESPVHEERMVALRILVRRYRTAGEADRRRFARFYLGNLDGVDNWDLVDISAPWVLGGEIAEGRLWPTVRRLAASPNLWRRRVAIVSTLGPIRRGQVEPALEMALILIEDREDLIQKASGWVLREVGKRDLAILTDFLDSHGSEMGRTALRYSIERLPEPRRKHYLEATRPG